MKAIQFYVSKRSNESIKVESDDMPKFYPYLHYHDEVQITYVEKGNGVLFAGSGFTDFKPGNLFLLGSNLPHVFKSNGDARRCKAISMYFSPEFGGSRFWDLPETGSIKKILTGGMQGYMLQSFSISEYVYELMISLRESAGMGRIIKLFEILEVIDKNEKQAISAVSYVNPPSGIMTKRMDSVLAYVVKNFKKPITLEEMANTANMTPESFCRFFKKKTRKTFKVYLNEVRMNYAGKLLVESDRTVAEIAYESGFRNISNFNRQFLKVRGRKPGEFRKLRGDQT